MQHMNSVQTILPIPQIERKEMIINDGEINKEEILTDYKKNKKEKYGKGNEAQSIRKEIGDFNLFDSKAYKIITSNFGKSIRFSELLGIINTINIVLKLKYDQMLPPISRNEKRSFPLLIKYVERNGEIIYPNLKLITLCDSLFHKIPLDP